MKAIFRSVDNTGTGVQVTIDVYDNSNSQIQNFPITLDVGNELSGVMTGKQIYDLIKNVFLAYAVTQSWSITENDFYVIGYNMFSPGDVTSILAGIQSKSFNYTPGRSIVTGTGATGFQVSSTRDSMITYSPKITTTATIAGGQEGYVVLEIASTNSATAGDWKEVGRVTNGQALSLALTLQSVQPVSSSLSAIVPAGYYVKIRSVNTTGSPSYSLVSGQEVLL